MNLDISQKNRMSGSLFVPEKPFVETSSCSLVPAALQGQPERWSSEAQQGAAPRFAQVLGAGQRASVP